MEKMKSPLHRVIDARRWDGERLLGRLFFVLHAAFLDAGFLPAAADPTGARLPRQVGASASTLSLRYLVPQLLTVVALRVFAHGRHVVFYLDTSSVSVSGAGRYLWACVDALAAAPLLSGGLDDTARALLASALWRELADGLGRRVLAEICGRGTSFMSLPEEMKAAIVARIGKGGDLARVSATCRELRRLVRDRERELLNSAFEAALRMTPADMELLKPVYDRLLMWKERYYGMEVSLIWYLFDDDMSPLPPPRTYDNEELDPPELAEMETPAEQSRGKGARRARAALPPSSSSSGGGREKGRHHAGATNSPSARYRWKHR